MASQRPEPVGVAIVGCGFAADFYAATMRGHPSIQLRGACDVLPERCRAFETTYGIPAWTELDRILSRPDIAVVANLTSSASHFEVTSRCLDAGKHVYSEKPLSLELAEAVRLVEMAERNGLVLASAPCTLLGRAGQTAWTAVASGAIGRPLVAYAELGSGPLRQLLYQDWIGASGAPWPFEEEFARGCVVEHAGYALTWLTALLGSATAVRAVSPDHVESPTVDRHAGTEFSVAVVEFESGACARVTCSTLGPVDHSLQIIGTEGSVLVDNTWQHDSRVTIRRRLHDDTSRRRAATAYAPSTTVRWVGPASSRTPYADTVDHDIDFAAGVADVGRAVATGGAPRLPARHALHVLEVLLAIDAGGGQPMHLTSKMPAMTPPSAACIEVDS